MPPRIAIVSQNILEATGLKSILEDIIPMADVSIFHSVDVLKDENEITPFVHYFVSAQMLMIDVDFFLQHKRQTILLVARSVTDAILQQFLSINTNVEQHELIKTILQLHSHGHADNRHPGLEEDDSRQLPISNREIEVLALVARGFINKEIADRLCISLPTVITHRKNICEKLNIRSVSALTIYAVMHGIVSIDEI